MGFPKGHKKVGGRKKGSVNITTANVKAALTQAFEGVGGVPALVKWGKANRTEFYKLWGRLVPTEIKNADGETFRMEMVEEIVDAADENHSPDGPTPPGSAPVPAQ